MNSQTRIVVLVASVAFVGTLLATLGGFSTIAPPSRSDIETSNAERLANAANATATATSAQDTDAAVAVSLPDREVAETSAVLSPLHANVQKRLRSQAALLAKKLTLSAADELALVAVLFEEQQRRAAALADLRSKPDDVEVRARVRTELDNILAWKTEALQAQFGAEQAAELMKRR